VSYNITPERIRLWLGRHCRRVASADFLKRLRSFTLIELLVVMAIIALLLSLAVPRYFGHVERTEEAVLRENLHLMREALDKYYGDNGRYPDALTDLVTRKYLRRIPPDPVTNSETTWISVPPDDPGKGRVADIRSGAEGKGRDGTPYRSW
jgi:general secretion pathway protein G